MQNQVVVWNTGRLYQRNGQVIAAIWIEGGIVFNDVSRMVDGFIPFDSNPLIKSASDIRSIVMARYDANKYEDNFGGAERAEMKRMIGTKALHSTVAAHQVIVVVDEEAKRAEINAQQPVVEKDNSGNSWHVTFSMNGVRYYVQFGLSLSSWQVRDAVTDKAIRRNGNLAKQLIEAGRKLVEMHKERAEVDATNAALLKRLDDKVALDAIKPELLDESKLVGHAYFAVMAALTNGHTVHAPGDEKVTIVKEDGQFVMNGHTGKHSICCATSDHNRLNAHWAGYKAQNAAHRKEQNRKLLDMVIDNAQKSIEECERVAKSDIREYVICCGDDLLPVRRSADGMVLGLMCGGDVLVGDVYKLSKIMAKLQAKADANRKPDVNPVQLIALQAKAWSERRVVKVREHLDCTKQMLANLVAA